MNHKNEKIKDYEPDYPDYKDRKDGYSMIIANHVTWMDSLLVGSLKNFSVVSKKAVSRIPLFGAIMSAL